MRAPSVLRAWMARLGCVSRAAKEGAGRAGDRGRLTHRDGTPPRVQSCVDSTRIGRRWETPSRHPLAVPRQLGPRLLGPAAGTSRHGMPAHAGTALVVVPLMRLPLGGTESYAVMLEGRVGDDMANLQRSSLPVLGKFTSSALGSPLLGC